MDWLNSRLDQLQQLGGQAYGALKNKGPIKGSRSRFSTDATASAAKAAAPKAGMKIKDWGPDQWSALAGALSPLMEMMQKRRRR